MFIKHERIRGVQIVVVHEMCTLLIFLRKDVINIRIFILDLLSWLWKQFYLIQINARHIIIIAVSIVYICQSWSIIVQPNVPFLVYLNLLPFFIIRIRQIHGESIVADRLHLRFVQ